jgi:hypothetical protein
MSLRDYSIRDNGDGTFSVWSSVSGRPPKKAAKLFKSTRAAKNYIGRVRSRFTGRINPLNALGEQRREIILARLTEAAENGEPMPTNAALAELIGLNGVNGYKTALCKHLSTLERQGHIRFQRGSHAAERRVTIVATGKRTDWQMLREYKSKPAPKKAATPGAYTFNRSLAGGYSDTFLYGALAEAVRLCRRRGDVVYRDPRNKMVILINGQPGDVTARAAWHASKAKIHTMNLQTVHNIHSLP